MTSNELTRRSRAVRTPASDDGDRLPEHSPLLRGRYALERLVEDEPLAQTYIGRDLVLDRILAVTVLQHHVAMKPHLVDQFLDVERRAGALFHPNLVTIFDVGMSDGTCWSAHEYCGGGTLRQRLPARQPIPGWQVGSLLSQLGSALATLHRIGLVHGRVSPDCMRFDDAGAARLGGVGLAAISDLPGLPPANGESDGDAYLAPEQRERAPSGAAADQYALALVAAELLGGSWHTSGLGAPDSSADDVLSYLRTSRPDVPHNSITALTRALSPDPERRFSSMEDFLLAFSGGTTETRTPPPRPPTVASGIPAARMSVATVEAVPSDMAVTRRWPKFSDGAPAVSSARERARSVTQQAVKSSSAGAARINHTSRQVASGTAVRCRTSYGLAVDWLRKLHLADRVLLVAGTVALLLALITVLPLALNPPPSFAAPSLEGRTELAARSLAAEGGLQVAVRQEASSTVPVGQVIRQETPPGALVRSDRPIALVVSNGPPPVPMPNILRRDLESARRDLESIGLTMGAVSEYDTNRQAWGTITAQTVRSGRSVPPGTAIDVTVATPPWTDAPPLVNRGLGDVEKDLDSRGLKLGEVRLQQADVRAGTVVAQDPPADTRLRQGSAVAVFVAVPSGSGPASP